MAYVDWMIRGPKIGSCSCDYGCPCEFNAPPTRAPCEGMECMRIEEGYFADVRLDGLCFAAAFRWPGAVHLGGGFAQGFIDERADKAQRQALLTILSGEEQAPDTVFNIYGSTIDTEYDPIFTPIEFTCDMESRVAKFTVPGILELSTEPIRNPVTGKAHRARIELPEGFEFRQAEMASASFKGMGEIRYEHQSCYGALFYVAYGPDGIIG